MQTFILTKLLIFIILLFLLVIYFIWTDKKTLNILQSKPNYNLVYSYGFLQSLHDQYLTNKLNVLFIFYFIFIKPIIKSLFFFLLHLIFINFMLYIYETSPFLFFSYCSESITDYNTASESEYSSYYSDEETSSSFSSIDSNFTSSSGENPMLISQQDSYIDDLDDIEFYTDEQIIVSYQEYRNELLGPNENFANIFVIFPIDTFFANIVQTYGRIMFDDHLPSVYAHSSHWSNFMSFSLFQQRYSYIFRDNILQEYNHSWNQNEPVAIFLRRTGNHVETICGSITANDGDDTLRLGPVCRRRVPVVLTVNDPLTGRSIRINCIRN